MRTQIITTFGEPPAKSLRPTMAKTASSEVAAATMPSSTPSSSSSSSGSNPTKQQQQQQQQQQQKDQQQGPLFHPSLKVLPTPVRFVLSGVIGNVFFMAAYNATYKALHKLYSATTVFSVVQFVCIVVNHFLNVGLVFGWPTGRYLSSLLSNMPVGLVSLAMGAFLAGYLEQKQFDVVCGEWVQEQLGWDMSSGNGGGDEEDDTSTLFSSVAVMLATGVFNYVALNLVNGSSSSSDSGKDKDKKDL